MVEELIEYGRPFNLGIEAGSKPELLVALALQENPDAPDPLQRVQGPGATSRRRCSPRSSGGEVIIIMDRVAELDTILAASPASSTSGP